MSRFIFDRLKLRFPDPPDDGAGGGGGGDPADKGGDGDKGGGGAPDDTGKDPSFLALQEKFVKAEQERERLKTEAEGYRKKLAKYRDEKGNYLDATAFAEWQKNQALEEERKQIERGEFEKLRQADRDAVAAAKQEASEVRAKWDREKVSMALIANAAALDPLPQAVHGVEGLSEPMIVRLFADQFKVDEHGFVVHNTRLGKDGKPLQPKEFLEEMKAGPAANLFKASLQSGSGASNASEENGSVIRIRSNADPVARQKAFDQAKAQGKRVEFV